MQEEHEAVGPIPDSLLRRAVAASILYLNGRVMLRRNILVMTVLGTRLLMLPGRNRTGFLTSAVTVLAQSDTWKIDRVQFGSAGNLRSGAIDPVLIRLHMASCSKM